MEPTRIERAAGDQLQLRPADRVEPVVGTELQREQLADALGQLGGRLRRVEEAGELEAGLGGEPGGGRAGPDGLALDRGLERDPGGAALDHLAARVRARPAAPA